jgi:hypothetical protein
VAEATIGQVIEADRVGDRGPGRKQRDEDDGVGQRRGTELRDRDHDDPRHDQGGQIADREPPA